MAEYKLPENILIKASVSPGGEHAWKKEDVPSVIEAARRAGLAPLGGQIQFQLPFATCEPCELDFGFGTVRLWKADTWQEYVNQYAKQTLDSFLELCKNTDFYEEAMRWQAIKDMIEQEGLNPLDYMRVILYFDEAPKKTVASKGKHIKLGMHVLIVILHGFAGLIIGVLLFCHQCSRGDKLFEYAMPYVMMGSNMLIAILCKLKYIYILLITLGIMALFFVLSEVYMNAIH